MPTYNMFEVYWARELPNIDADKEIICSVVNRDTFSMLLVRAKLARKTEDLPGSEELWITDDVGVELPDNPRAIKIVEELDPDKVSFTYAPAGTKPIYAK